MNWWRMVVVFLLVVFLLVSEEGYGWNPPQDTVGPVTVSIEGPAEFALSDGLLLVKVCIQNTSGDAISGTVRLSVIDDWKVGPLGEVAWTVEGHGSIQVPFAVEAGAKSYNVHYPIHAFATFKQGNDIFRPHAILITKIMSANTFRVMAPMAWRVMPVQPDSSVELAAFPVYRPLVVPNGERVSVLSPGFEGTEPITRASFVADERVGRPDERAAFAMHPPYYEGHVGASVVEYPFELPANMPIRLQFATAIRTQTAQEPPSDGVTFRVRVVDFDAPDGTLGTVLFERHSDAKTWEDGEADLSAWAGKQVRIQLESHAGPKNDPTCDGSYWGNPVLLVGEPPIEGTELPEANRLVGTVVCDGVSYDVWAGLGHRGLLDGTVVFTNGDKRLSFHGFHVVVAGNSLEERGSGAQLVEVKEDVTSSGALTIRHCFRDPLGTYDLVGTFGVAPEGTLQVQFHLENTPEPGPWKIVYIEDLAVGSWDQEADQVYAGVGNVLRKPKAFELWADGHQLATSYVGFDFGAAFSLVQGVDVPPVKLVVSPKDRKYAIHAPQDHTVTLIPCQDVWAGVRAWRALDTRPAGGGVKKLAGRFVFDLWGGTYGQARQALEQAFQYGLTDSLVVWHAWQRWGYDYRLPEIMPPNSKLGTADEFRALVDVCKRYDVLFAPHDNYVDFYPDADGFTYQRIAFSKTGQPIVGWLNSYCGAQAYRWSPDAYEPFLEQNVKTMLDQYFQPTAYFIDVWSSMGASDSWTWDGRLITRMQNRDAWGKSFAWIRDMLGNGPTISESGHDQLLGYLDGAQCNHLQAGETGMPEGKDMVWHVEFEDAERTPWMDAAYHDRFALHGAGYDPRYRAGLNPVLHGIYSDDYICSEVMDGHPDMVDRPFGRDVVRKYWLLHGLMRSLAGVHIQRVEYVDGNLHRQHVVWDNGDVYVNRGAEDWSVTDRVLPQYGFFAHVTTGDGVVEAAIERVDGVIREWSTGPGWWYVNARSVSQNTSLPPEMVARMNPDAKATMLGWISTSGGCYISLSDKELNVKLLPDSETVHLSFDLAKKPAGVGELRRAVVVQGDVHVLPLVENDEHQISVELPDGITDARILE